VRRIHKPCAQITGFSFDGGYAQYLVAPQEALALVPEQLDAAEAAPLMCAAVTTFNALRHSVARQGDLVAVQGLGGLGHLGVQFAHRLGFRTVAVSRGTDKEELARRLGADEYIDADAADPARELPRRGGARVVLTTAPSGKAIGSIIGGSGRTASCSSSQGPRMRPSCTLRPSSTATARSRDGQAARPWIRRTRCISALCGAFVP
jgi:D-arabinose 1-dehydrogenase-like Zn-dependent alcohol dehydrogenase